MSETLLQGDLRGWVHHRCCVSVDDVSPSSGVPDWPTFTYGLAHRLCRVGNDAVKASLALEDNAVVIVLGIRSTFIICWKSNEVAVELSHIDWNQPDVKLHQIGLVPSVFVATHDPGSLVARVRVSADPR